MRRHRDRAAVEFDQFDFLVRNVGDALGDRLEDIKRNFPLALDLGCRNGQMSDILKERGGIQDLVQMDQSLDMVRRTAGPRLVADEEYLPFADASLDLVVSCLNLHWVNDLPGTLLQLRRSLKPDGLFLASFFGGDTLTELRAVLMAAEDEAEGGASPRISPFADVRDGGNLLQRAGFALTVADTDTLTVSYESPLKLMHDLRGMAETNSVLQRRKSFSRRETLLRAAQLYGERYGDEQGRVPATFEIITLTGWAPAPGQQQPLAPGSAQSSLTSALGDTGE